MRRKMTELRNQGAQDRDQLRGADVLYLHDLCHDVIGARRATGSQWTSVLSGCRVRDYLDDVAARHSRELMHFQDREKSLIEGFRRHRSR